MKYRHTWWVIGTSIIRPCGLFTPHLIVSYTMTEVDSVCLSMLHFSYQIMNHDQTLIKHSGLCPVDVYSPPSFSRNALRNPFV